MASTVSLFGARYNTNDKLYNFYLQVNPQKAKAIKKQQEATQKVVNEARYTAEAYNAEKYQAAKDKIASLQTQVTQLMRSASPNGAEVSKKISAITKDLANAMVEYVRAGGGRKDLLPPELGGGRPLYDPDDPNARPKAYTGFFITDPVGKQIKKMTEDLESLAKRVELRGQLRNDAKVTEPLAEAKDFLAQLKNEFSVLRSMRVTPIIDIEV